MVALVMRRRAALPALSVAALLVAIAGCEPERIPSVRRDAIEDAAGLATNAIVDAGSAVAVPVVPVAPATNEADAQAAPADAGPAPSQKMTL